MADPQNSTEFKVLLSVRNPQSKSAVKGLLEKNYPSQLKLTEIDLLQDAMELLEKKESKFSIIIFEHNSPSVSLVKAFLELGNSATFIMCANDLSPFEALKTVPTIPEFVLITELDSGLLKVLKKLSTIGKIPALPTEDGDAYFATNVEALLAMKPLRYDIFVKMSQGRMVRIFAKGVELETADLEKYNKNKVEKDFFFIKKADSESLLKEQNARLEKLAGQSVVSQKEAAKEYQNSVASVRDMVSSVGFTPEAQMMAKSCVAMALKALGAKPELSNILVDLKKKEGDYIVSHSFMVGQVSCALAHKIGWNSAGTFLKLSLAGFMHDISLNAGDAEFEDSLEESQKTGKITAKQAFQLKLHPMQGAEYSRQFTEIPSDVDHILAQHHERPDGSGYPRSLHAKLISPLAALFIMSHDLVNEVYKNPDTNIDDFFLSRESKYELGHFRKIILALKSSEQA